MFSFFYTTSLALLGGGGGGGTVPASKVQPFDPASIDALQKASPGFYFTELGQLFSGKNGFTPVTLIFFVAGAVFLINTILAGFSMMTSAGNPQGMESAKVRLTNSIIGLILVFTAYFIVQIVGLVLNLPGITGEFTG